MASILFNPKATQEGTRGQRTAALTGQYSRPSRLQGQCVRHRTMEEMTFQEVETMKGDFDNLGPELRRKLRKALDHLVWEKEKDCRRVRKANVAAFELLEDGAAEGNSSCAMMRGEIW